MMKRYLRPFAGTNPIQIGEPTKEFARDEVELLSKGGHDQTRAILGLFSFTTDCEKAKSTNSRK